MTWLSQIPTLMQHISQSCNFFAFYIMPYTLITKFSCSYCFLSPAYIQATSPSWCLLWSWRATCLCGCLLSASTKCVSPSAPTLWWRSAPKALAHRLMFSGWAAFIYPLSSKNASFCLGEDEVLTVPVRAFHYDLIYWGVLRLLEGSASVFLVEGKKYSSIFSFSYLCKLCAAGCFWDFGQNT